MPTEGMHMARWEPLLEQVMRERAPRLLAYAAMLTGDDAEAHDVLAGRAGAHASPVAAASTT